ncbi:pyridoxamine 5'-phosphate oxidase family protein [Corynebacterium sp. 335C]
MTDTNDTDPVIRLTEEESLELLATNTFGRLVVRRKDDMDLFPLNYVVDGGRIVFRTAEGSKLFSLTLNDDVLFESDQVDRESGKAWSVIVKGTARALTSTEEIRAADELPLRPWLPTLKYNYVEVRPNEVSGRRFNLGEEPERY